MSSMPVELLYLFVLLITIIVVFVFYKRPIYEGMFIGFVLMVLILGKEDKFFEYLIKPSTNTLFYAILAFLSLAFIFSKTSAINYVLDFIIAIVGRFRGGAGWVSLIASTFLASMSGSGPGNVAASGVFTIPTMIRTGFPREAAATIEMAASSLGPMIPPSGTILLAFGVLDSLFPGKYQLSAFWMAAWGIGIWFIIQRSLTLYGFIRTYDVQPMYEEEIPSIKDTVRKGWKALVIPIMIILPMLLDFLFSDNFFTARLGEDGAKALSSCVILFTPGISAIYTLIISRDEIEGGLSFSTLFKMFKEGVSAVVPVAATVYFAYCLSEVFNDVNMGATLGEYISSFNMSRLQLAIFFPLFTCFLGMFIPGSSQVAIFGVAIVSGFVAVGVNPLLAAAILPAITGAVEGMTPPLALSMYTAMGIAQSGMKETSRAALLWVFFHLITSILILVGVLPVLFV
ncbi:MAG: TRAP transporter large permease subunit [Tissierellia bacterium]|nr:TRAP transporter large permease subunit [Tissierellia bacterium]